MDSSRNKNPQRTVKKDGAEDGAEDGATAPDSGRRVTPDCSLQIEEGLKFSLNVGWSKRLSRKWENVFPSESILLRAFLP